MADAPYFTTDEKLERRFWAKVKIAGPDECWEWTAHTGQGGYGRFAIDKYAHNACHVALVIGGRDRPPGKFALHSCDNRLCVNPRHLRWGTAKENGRDKSERGRSANTTGINHPGCKLTEQQVRDIFAATGTLTAIADQYGITFSAVWLIKHRKLWRHLEL